MTKSFTFTKRLLREMRRTPREQAGQPCPRCGDLWPWSMLRCGSCGAKLH